MLLAAVLGAGRLEAQAPRDGRTTVWSGVYTEDQAARGKAAYLAECAQCHQADLWGFGGALRGRRFMDRWRETQLQQLFTIVQTTMPPRTPLRLSEETYLDIVAYILQVNEFPGGEEELTQDRLAAIRVEGKEGPQPVPDFSIVRVIGCLEQDTDGGWLLSHGSEPARAEHPRTTSDAEEALSAATPFGSGTFTLMSVAYFKPETMAGGKVEGKGILIRNPDGDRINVSSLRLMEAACAE